MAIEITEGGSEIQSRDDVCRLLEELEGGRWMACVWYVSDDGRLHQKSVCWNFPRSEFDRCVGMLRKYIAEDRKMVEEAEMPAPLPRADIFRIPGDGAGR